MSSVLVGIHLAKHKYDVWPMVKLCELSMVNQQLITKLMVTFLAVK